MLDTSPSYMPKFFLVLDNASFPKLPNFNPDLKALEEMANRFVARKECCSKTLLDLGHDQILFGFSLLGAHQDARPQRDARALRKDGLCFPARFVPSARVKAAEVPLESIRESLGHPAGAAVEGDAVMPAAAFVSLEGPLWQASHTFVNIVHLTKRWIR